MKLRTLLLATAALTVTAFSSTAGAQELLKGQLLTGTEIFAKPGIQIAYPATIMVDGAPRLTPSCSSTDANVDVTITCNGEDFAEYCVFIKPSEDKTQSIISIITRDEKYFAPGSEVVLTMPKLWSDNTDDAITNYTADDTPEVFTFHVKDYVTIEGDMTSNEIEINPAKGLLIKQFAELVVKENANLEYGQLIIEGESGLIINENASLTIADTTYMFSSPWYTAATSDNHSYIINHGTFSAASTVFTRYYPVVMGGTNSIGCPVYLDNFLDVSLDAKVDVYYQKINTKLTKFTDKERANTSYAPGSFSLVFATKQPEQIIRLKGRLFDDDEIFVNSSSTPDTKLAPSAIIPNPYPFAIDLKKVYDCGDMIELPAAGAMTTNVATQNYGGSVFSQSISTYDADKSLGNYLPAGCGFTIASYNILTARLAKEYAHTYNRNKSVSEDNTTDYNYIRLYVDKVGSNNVGDRDVSCLYFMDGYTIPNRGTDRQYEVETNTVRYKWAKVPLIQAVKNGVDVIVNAQPQLAADDTVSFDLRVQSPQDILNVKVGILDSQLPPNTEVYLSERESDEQYTYNLASGAGKNKQLTFNDNDIVKPQKYLYYIKNIRLTIVTRSSVDDGGNATGIGSAAGNAPAIAISPISGGVSIAVPAECAEPLRFAVNDLSGRLIQNGNLNNGNNNIAISQNGIIFVSVFNGAVKCATAKIKIQ